MSVRRILGSFWLRLVVTLGLLGLVATGIDWGLVEDRLLGGDVGWLVVAVVCVVAALAVGALRWQALLELAHLHIGWRELGRVYAVSTFSQSFLPTSIGGDVARALLVVRRGPLLGRAISTVVVDRAGGFAGLVVVSFMAVAVAPTSQAPDGAMTGLVWATGIGTLLTVVSIAVLRHRPRRLVALIPERAMALAVAAWSVLDRVLRTPSALAIVVVTSAVFQALVALQVWALARCLGIDLSFVTAALTLTLVTFATLFPISIGGFGIREGSYALLLGSVGVSTTDATLISLGTVVVLLIASLPGAVLLATGGMRPVLEGAGR